jgi:hypothetical protein
LFDLYHPNGCFLSEDQCSFIHQSESWDYLTYSIKIINLESTFIFYFFHFKDFLNFMKYIDSMTK